MLRKEYPCGQLRSAFAAMSHPSFLSTVASSLWGAEMDVEKASLLCKYCSAIAKILLHYQHCLNHKSKVHHCMSTMKKMSSIPTKPVHNPNYTFTILISHYVFSIDFCDHNGLFVCCVLMNDEKVDTGSNILLL